jgi:hypothetical protein
MNINFQIVFVAIFMMILCFSASSHCNNSSFNRHLDGSNTTKNIINNTIKDTCDDLNKQLVKIETQLFDFSNIPPLTIRL